MIELRVESYCQECKKFSPVTETFETENQYEYNMMDRTGRIIPGLVHTTIKCEHAVLCARLYKHIQNEINKKEERRNNETR